MSESDGSVVCRINVPHVSTNTAERALEIKLPAGWQVRIVAEDGCIVAGASNGTDAVFVCEEASTKTIAEV